MSEEQTSVSESSMSTREEELDNKNGNNESDTRMDNNGNGQKNHQHRLVHSVSIVVEPVPLEDVVNETDPLSSSTPFNVGSTCHKGRQSPVILLEDFDLSETGNEKSNEDDIVKSIIANARLRKEEFARLLEEHAQLVSEINRVETSLL